MAGADNLGCCGLLECLCGLVEVFLDPQSGGGFARRQGSSSSRIGRTRSPWDVDISFAPPAARNSPVVAADLSWSSSQAGRTSLSRVVSPVFRDLRFDYQEKGLSPLARNSTAVGGDLCSSSSRGVRAGSAPGVAAISSPQQTGMAGGVEEEDDDDDDDCVILDIDPHSAVTVMGEKEGSAGDDGSDEELQIVAEKGQVACRDFPHSRHLCSNMPFGTTSHEKHCTMCYCFVCDAPAPCSYWGKGLWVDDHCHATDKETKWKTLREAFRQRSNGSGTSSGHSAQISHPISLNVSAPRAHPAAGAGRGTSNAHTTQISHPVALTSSAPRASSATRVQSGTNNAHTAQISQPLALTASAPRASSAARVQSSTSNGHNAQVTHLVEPTVSAPRAHPAAGAGRGTSNAHTAQISHPRALTVSAPRASSATRVQSGTSNAHSAQGTHLAEATVSAPRAHPAAGAGRGTSNAHTAQISHPLEPTARPYSATRTGRGTSNGHTSQITLPVEPTTSATRAYSAARTGRGTSNTHASQITRPVERTVSAPRVYPGARAGRDSSNAHSAPEGATVHVRNLPCHIDNERLKLSFQQAGVVLFAKVIYDRETGQSRGFGYVTMSTVQEAETAVRIYHGSEVYGSPLIVNIAAPRGGARVDTTHRQSGSPITIFVCNLPTQVNHSRLGELFSKHGKVVDAKVIYECREGAWCSRGFGFVTMATEEESYNAIHALNKQVLEGHALVVKVARERPERGCPSLSNQIPPQNAVSQNQNTHTSVRASLNVVPTVSAPGASYPATRARSGTSNANTAQVTHQLDPTVSAPRPREHRMLPLV